MKTGACTGGKASRKSIIMLFLSIKINKQIKSMGKWATHTTTIKSFKIKQKIRTPTSVRCKFHWCYSVFNISFVFTRLAGGTNSVAGCILYYALVFVHHFAAFICASACMKNCFTGPEMTTINYFHFIAALRILHILFWSAFASDAKVKSSEIIE